MPKSPSTLSKTSSILISTDNLEKNTETTTTVNDTMLTDVNTDIEVFLTPNIPVQLTEINNEYLEIKTDKDSILNVNDCADVVATKIVDEIDKTTVGYTTTDVTNDEEVITTFSPTPEISRRKKLVDNVLMVYPSEMSGIPKTTPKNKLENNQMNMYDEEMGMHLHLVFATDDTEPITSASSRIEESSLEHHNHISTPDTTSMKPKYNEVKKRRRYRPNRERTSTIEKTESPFLKQINKSTRNRTSSSFYKKQQRHDEFKTTTFRTFKSDSENSSREKTYESRYRLLNANSRLNFLRKNKSIRTTKTKHIPKNNDYDDNSSGNRSIPVDDFDLPNIEIIELSPNQTFMSRIDTQHKQIIEKVRLVLVSAASTHSSPLIVSAPSSFADGSEVNSRITHIENMLVDKLNNTLREMKSTNEDYNAQYRPYRGQTRYQSSDISSSFLNSIIIATTKPPNVNWEDSSSLALQRRIRPSLVKTHAAQTTTVSTIETELPKKNEEHIKKITNLTSRRKIGSDYRRRQKTTTENPQTGIPIGTLSNINPLTTETTTISLNLDEQILETEQILSTSTRSHLALAAGSFFAEFKPSPLWTLHDEVHTTKQPFLETANIPVISQRQSRDAFHEPRLITGGFTPIIKSDKALYIIGPIPKSHPVHDDGIIRFGLPSMQANKF